MRYGLFEKQGTAWVRLMPEFSLPLVQARRVWQKALRSLRNGQRT